MNDLPAPFVSLQSEVKAEWIDFNGHFNAGYYMVVFDEAVGPWMDHIGITTTHRAEHDVTTFSVEGHITYDRELDQGAPIEVRTQLLDWSPKAIHAIHLMYHGDDGWLAATNELMSLHISNHTRRSAPMAPVVQQRLAEVEAAHRMLPVPEQVGRLIGIRRG